ncbi:MAG: ketopantoate reductase family protein [Aggregatilineales bacterium]
MRPLRLLIVGATPLGAYLAAHATLIEGATAQPAVWLADPATVEAVKRAGGIEVFWAQGRLWVGLNTIHLTASYDEAFAAEYDAALFVMHGYETAPTLFEMRGRVAQPPPIVSLQRGIGNVERIASVYGADRVIRGALTVTLDQPLVNGKPALETVVLHPSGGIGLADDHPLSRDLAAFLTSAGLSVIVDNGRDLQWSALFWQLYGNAIPALVDLPFEDVRGSPTLFRLEYRQLLEALGIIQALGVRLIDLPGAPVSDLARLLQTWPARLVDVLATRLPFNPAPPGLRIELARGVPHSEAAYLNGAIAIHAHDLKRHAPANHALALALQDIAEGRAVWSQFQRNPRMIEALIGVAGGH